MFYSFLSPRARVCVAVACALAWFILCACFDPER